MIATLPYLRELFFATSPSELEEARLGAKVAELAAGLRLDAGITQRAMAQLIGTDASVICRLERDDYRGAPIVVLVRIATALGQRVRVGLAAGADGDTTR